MPLFSLYSDTIARSLLLSMGELFELRERSFLTLGSKTLRLRPPYTNARPNLFDIDDLGVFRDPVHRVIDLTRLTIIKPDGTSRDWGNYSIQYSDNPPRRDSDVILVIDGDTTGTAWDRDNDVLVFYYEQISLPSYEPVLVYGVYDTVIRENTETTVEVVIQHPNVMMSFRDINEIQPHETSKSSVLDKLNWDIIRQRTGRVYEISHVQLDEVSTCRYLLRSID